MTTSSQSEPAFAVATPVITNLVVTLSLGTRIDPVQVCMALNGKYGKQKFPSVVSRCRSPRATNSISASGRVVCTGTLRECDVLLSNYRMALKLRRDLGIDAQVLNAVSTNIVTATSVPFRINLNLFYDDHQDLCSYDPFSFSGCIFRKRDEVLGVTFVYVLYESGQVVCPGLRHTSHRAIAVTHLSDLHKYRIGHEYRQIEESRKRLSSEMEKAKTKKLETKKQKTSEC